MLLSWVLVSADLFQDALRLKFLALIGHFGNFIDDFSSALFRPSFGHIAPSKSSTRCSMCSKTCTPHFCDKGKSDRSSAPYLNVSISFSRSDTNNTSIHARPIFSMTLASFRTKSTQMSLAQDGIRHIVFDFQLWPPELDIAYITESSICAYFAPCSMVVQVFMNYVGIAVGAGRLLAVDLACSSMFLLSFFSS